MYSEQKRTILWDKTEPVPNVPNAQMQREGGIKNENFKENK